MDWYKKVRPDIGGSPNDKGFNKINTRRSKEKLLQKPIPKLPNDLEKPGIEIKKRVEKIDNVDSSYYLG